MRKGFARRADDAAVSHRQRRRAIAQAVLSRTAGLLLSVLLVLQLTGIHLPVHRVSPVDAEAIALASLSAAIGQPVPFCDHGDPAHPGDPTSPNGCDHCIFCHYVGAGFAVVPTYGVAVARKAIATRIERPATRVAFVRPPYAGGSTPRGPPISADETV